MTMKIVNYGNRDLKQNIRITNISATFYMMVNSMSFRKYAISFLNTIRKVIFNPYKTIKDQKMCTSINILRSSFQIRIQCRNCDCFFEVTILVTDCIDPTKYCQENDVIFTEVPRKIIPSNTIDLVIANNSIPILKNDSFEGLFQLKNLVLSK